MEGWQWCAQSTTSFPRYDRPRRTAEAADALIRQYMGFIRSETVKFLHTAPENGHEDELSIAMLAFYEAVLAYEKSRGAFLPYAARAIKNRLIDHYRTEKRHGNVISLHTPLGGEEDGGELLDTIPDTVDHAGDYAVRTASRREIQEFSEKLAQFGLTFSDVADNCPRQERTFAACRRVLDFARTQPELLKRVEDTGKLPMGELSASSGTDKKTMERHRKYLVAILLAFTNGYEIIRGHLCQVGPGRQPALSGGGHSAGHRGAAAPQGKTPRPVEAPVRRGWPGRLSVLGVLWLLPAKLHPLRRPAHPDQPGCGAHPQPHRPGAGAGGAQ